MNNTRNNALIKQVIERNGDTCPPFKYKYPLLDKEIADLFARGLIDLVQTLNSSEDTPTRLGILQYIRNLCRKGPQHLVTEPDVFEVLQKAFKKCPINCRNGNEGNTGSPNSASYKQEIIQALRNLDTLLDAHVDKENIY